MRRRIRALGNVIDGPSDVWLGIRMAAWSAALPLLKRLLPLRVLTRLMWTNTRRAPRADREDTVTFLMQRIYRARPYLRRDNCLDRSLLTYRFLAREGLEPRLVLGAQKSDGQIQMHAWVTIDGRPLIEDPETLGRFTPLAEFGARGLRSDDRAGISLPLA